MFLDRDGVINETDVREGRAVAPTRFEDFRFMPGIHELVKMLRAEEFKLIVVTNQPDAVHGGVERETIERMHQRVYEVLEVEKIYACFHVDSDGCECRKPKPGMLLEAAKDFHIELAQSFVIGDTWRDMEAGKAAGCTTILLSNGYNGYKENCGDQIDSIVYSLREAGETILAGTRQT